MQRRLQGLFSLDFLLIAGLAGCIAVFLSFGNSQQRVLLLDRPRADFQDADFVHEFLEVTQTPYDLEEGFVTLKSSEDVQKRLLQLLSCLSTAISVAEHNLNVGSGERLRCFPSPTGEIHVVADAKSQGIPLMRDQQQLHSLERQHAAILAAIQVLDPGAVGRPSLGNATNIASLPIPLVNSQPDSRPTEPAVRQVSAWNEPAPHYSPPPRPTELRANSTPPPAPAEEVVDLDEIPSEPAPPQRP